MKNISWSPDRVDAVREALQEYLISPVTASSLDGDISEAYADLDPVRDTRVTPDTGPGITPVVYLDIEMDDADAVSTHELSGYGDLHLLSLHDIGPGGGPMYRIEGPLPALVKWIDEVYVQDPRDTLLYVSELKLAR